jgi:hypothetical protein
MIRALRRHGYHSLMLVRHLAGHRLRERDMPPRRLKGSALFLFATLNCSGTGGDATGPGVEVGQASLPAAGAAYHGAVAHRFLGGSAELDCGSHGEFTGAVAPPATQGATVTADYSATFKGQLVLAPPLVPAPVTHPLSVQARMVERITLAGTQGAMRTFDTELVTFELGGSTAPAGAMVRESPSVASTGRTTITALSGGQYRIESFYDVWLELSLDGGGTWHPAEEVVRMTLGPPTP